MLDAPCMGRKRWSVEEKRRIVELTLVPGASVARVAQAEGVNANQVFLWRRSYRNGELLPCDSAALLPVVISVETDRAPEISSGRDVAEPVAEQSILAPPLGAIHIEFPGRALVTIETGVDAALAGAVIERLAR